MELGNTDLNTFKEDEIKELDLKFHIDKQTEILVRSKVIYQIDHSLGVLFLDLSLEEIDQINQLIKIKYNQRDKIKTIKRFQTKNMTSEELDTLLSDVKILFSSVIDGDSEEYFESLKSTPEMIIHIFYNIADLPVGVNVIKIYRDIQLNGEKEKTIIGSSAQMLKEYRGGEHTIKHAIKEAINLKLKQPFKEFQLVTSVIHPSAYYLFAKNATVMDPHYHTQIPSYNKFAQDFYKNFIDPNIQLRSEGRVIHFGLHVKIDDRERNFLEQPPF